MTGAPCAGPHAFRAFGDPARPGVAISRCIVCDVDEADTITPRRGLRFEHAKFRQALPGMRVADSPGEVCRVTQVRGGTVYYRTDDGAGGKWCTTVGRFADSVARVLPDQPEEVSHA